MSTIFSRFTNLQALKKVIDELDKNMSTLKAQEQKLIIAKDGLHMGGDFLQRSSVYIPQHHSPVSSPPLPTKHLSLPEASSLQTINPNHMSVQGIPTITSSGAQIPQQAPCLKVRQALILFEEVLRLELEVFQLPIDLATLFPGYYQQLPGNYQQLLWNRVQSLKAKVEQMGVLHDSVLSVVKSESIALKLEKVILEGKNPVGNLQAWVKENYPSNNPSSTQPRTLIIHIMRWLNSLLKVWEQVLDEDCE